MCKKEEKDEKEEGKRKYNMKEKIAMQKTMYY